MNIPLLLFLFPCELCFETTLFSGPVEFSEMVYHLEQEDPYLPYTHHFLPDDGTEDSHYEPTE
jgi:hypothetical protein